MHSYRFRLKYDDLTLESINQATDLIEGEPAHLESVRVLLAWFPLKVRTIADRQNWDEAEAKIAAAMEMAKELDDQEGVAAALARFETIYHRQDRFEDPTQAAQRRLEISRDPRSQDARSVAIRMPGSH